ncbi:DNA cytosine methyltransferase [Halomonas sp. ML-15]|uniref:DNA cytosine methyltransferase n=1 Tax=Halomonas sp. ML-15 TaxID=2773305 RepID=UPI0017468E60|nr:DNA cytosine methyltransferase [Halomonas sp. ML-15]MBD3894940.1 DNA cytosine methyltransferase [Halomonas sp. ML-15]
MHQTSETLNAVDLFSGCGGLTEGLKQAGVKVIGALEFDAKACQTYKLNHPEVELIEDDIRRISPECFSNKLKIEKGKLDLLAGCPPCQGFSTLRTRNKRASRDERNALIDNFLSYVIHLSPKSVMLENVPGLEKHYRFKQFVSSLRREGYKVSYKILDVSDYGVAQRRNRLILLANKLQDPVFADKIKMKETVASIIGGLESPSESKDDIHTIPEKRTNQVKEIIKNIPKDGGSRKDLPEHLVLKCHISFSGFSDVYGRMKWDSQSPTITSGCHNPSKGRFLHPDEDRTVTLREASLLQGFPKDYKFIRKHGKESLGLMIGNALPPPFIKAHAAEIVKVIRNAS